MATKMTDAQLQAVSSSGKNVLVSASAGSGKTFVMIERIIRLITEENVDVSNVLAVTYTRLAASEMKQKLVKAVIKKINEGKDVERMRKTLAEIPTADISTIHSFCLNLLRTYFYSANVELDFSILDEAKARELCSLAIDETFAELYQKNDERFLRLVRIYRKYRGDSSLKEEILSLHKKSVSESNPQEFLQGCKQSVSQENYAFYENFLLETYKKMILAKANGYNDLKNQLLAFDCDKLCDDLKITLDDVWAKACTCLKATTLQELLFACQLKTISMPRKSTDDEALLEIKGDISEYKTTLGKIFTKITENIPSDRNEDLNNFLQTKDVVCAIVDTVSLYSQKLAALKEMEGALDFSDLEHKTLALLKTNPDVLESVREKYKYIFADEYQDVNGVQEEILTLISQDNLFMVGDVKQSIYAFRGCNPDIFATKYDAFLKDGGLGTAISLDKNFRSSDKVLSAVNNVFSSVITKEHGGVDYATNPMQRGDLFEEGYGDAILHVIESEKPDKQPIDGLYNLVEDALNKDKDEDFYEGALVAQVILQELDKTVYDEKTKTERKVNLSDVAVLTRNSTGYTDEIVKRLVREGIPVVSESKTDILQYPEIKLLTDVLRLISFYADDPPLASVLKSAIGKITDSELATIRAFGLKNIVAKEKPSFLRCVEKYSDCGDDISIKNKLVAFNEYFNKIRILAEFMGAGELLAKIMRETGLDLEIASRNLGKIRLLRIERFIAESQPEGKALSVNEFLDKISSAESFTASSEVAGEDAVKVMSMHASKGLEYPIVIIPGLHKRFNALDDAQEILFSRKHGIAVYHYDEEKKVRSSTLQRTFFKQLAALERANEEARVFYVAMTRAKARLHLITTKEVKKEHGEGDYLSTSSFADFLSIKDMPIETHTENTLLNGLDTSVKTVSLNGGKASLIDMIYKNLSFEYPFINDVGLPLKSSVTEINKRHNDLKEKSYSSYNNLAFVGYVEENAKLQGTANHKFLELCDFNDKNADNQLIRLLSEGKLTKELADSLNVDMLNNILKQPVWDELKDFKLYREQPFLTTFTAKELFSEESDAPILIQGIIDLLAVKDGKAILIDYKDSSHSADRLKEDYSMQLSLYKRAIEKCLDLAVEKTYILSLKAGELIEI